jgi:LysM repeat protein
MKTTFRHFLWICVLLCSDAQAQGGAATYTVKPGDSFAKIARNTGCTPAELAKANDLKLTAVIHPGQKLKLPGKTVAQAAAAPDDAHTIQPGDTLTSISRRYGVSLDSLLAANPGINPKTLRPGQKVRIAPSKPSALREELAGNQPATRPPSVPPAANPPAGETTDAQDPAQETEVSQAAGQVQTVMVEAEMTYGEFAAKHGTDIARLNDLNGLDLAASTVLAKGSELYVPGQP